MTKFSRRPKKWTSWRVCPNCGDRSTKLFHLGLFGQARPYKCQVCGCRYAPPTHSRAKRGATLYAPEQFGFRAQGGRGGCYFNISATDDPERVYLEVGWSCVVVHDRDIPVTWLSELVAIATGHPGGIAAFLAEHDYGGPSYALMCDPAEVET